jgi:hypothetical protein
MLMGKHEYITHEQEKIVDGWIEKGEWLSASNISMLHEQGHEITDEQKDVYAAWQCAKRDVLADIKKNTTYRRHSAYHVELIANPETERACPCCRLTYTVSRLRTSSWTKKCMLCHPTCRQRSPCLLVTQYAPHDHHPNPFPEIHGEPRDTVFPEPK